MPKALIIGYGYVGFVIDQLLSENGFETTGVKRQWTDDQIEHANCQPIEGNLTDPDDYDQFPGDPDVIVNCASSGARGNPQRYRTVYKEGSRTLLDWAAQRSPKLVVWTGSTSVYGQQDGEWVHEDTSLPPSSPSSEILVETERLYQQAHEDHGTPTCVFRCAGIYGAGRLRALRMVRSNRDGWGRRGLHYVMNMIHRHDIARAILALFNDPQPGETFNLVDTEPTVKRDVLIWIHEQVGKPVPDSLRNTEVTSPENKKVSCDKLIDRLDFEHEFPSFREGYQHGMETNEELPFT